MKLGVGYYRVSSEKQTDGYGLDIQKSMVEEYCKKEGIELVKEFIDGGFTGSNTDRYGLQSLIEYIKKNKIEYLIVYTISRLSRNLYDLLTIIKDLESIGCSIIFIKEGIVSDSIQGKMLINIIGLVGEIELGNIRNFTYKGLLENANNGKKNGGKMLGFNIVKGNLIPIEEEVIIVKKIFNLFLKYKDIKKVVLIINKNYKTIRSNNFTYNSILYILQNKTYIGFIEYSNIIVEGNHKAIIRIEDFLKAQWFINFKEKEVICLDCYNTMVKHNTNKYKYYRCSSNKYNKLCHSNLININKLNNLDLIDFSKLEVIKNFTIINQLIEEEVSSTNKIIKLNNLKGLGKNNNLYKNKNNKLKNFLKLNKTISFDFTYNLTNLDYKNLFISYIFIKDKDIKYIIVSLPLYFVCKPYSLYQNNFSYKIDFLLRL